MVFPWSRNSMSIGPRRSKKTVSITFPAEGTALNFLGGSDGTSSRQRWRSAPGKREVLQPHPHTQFLLWFAELLRNPLRAHLPVTQCVVHSCPHCSNAVRVRAPAHAHNHAAHYIRVPRCLTTLSHSGIYKFQPVWLLRRFVPFHLITRRNIKLVETPPKILRGNLVSTRHVMRSVWMTKRNSKISIPQHLREIGHSTETFMIEAAT